MCTFVRIIKNGLLFIASLLLSSLVLSSPPPHPSCLLTCVQKNTHVFFSTHVCSFSKMCSKVCSFARLTFGLVEAANRTNGQFTQSNSSFDQTKYQPHQCWQKNDFFYTCVFFLITSLYKKKCFDSNELKIRRKI